MYTATRVAYQRAIDRAKEDGGALGVADLGSGRYEVPSSSQPGLYHTVTVRSEDDWACTCKHGRYGRPCRHQGRVWHYRLARGGLVTA